MTVSDLAAARSTAPPSGGPGADKPRNPEQAAEQFEAVFVRQFVQVMTKGLFDSQTEGGALASGQSDMQRDVLTDALTDNLVESGALKLSDLLLRQWSTSGLSDDADLLFAPPPSTASPAPPPTAAASDTDLTA